MVKSRGDGGGEDTSRGWDAPRGVISALLVNLFPHQVMDKWFEQERRPYWSGWAMLVRHADDVAMMFSLEKNARRVLAV